MERIEAGDVLQVIRARVDELERENAVLREARDELLSALAKQRREVMNARTIIIQSRKSRDKWRKKATDRQVRNHALENRIKIMTNPSHPMFNKTWFGREVAA